MADNYPSDIDESRLAKESLTVDSFALPAVVQAAREKLADPEALYLSLVRALRRRKGFGIVFLQCTPAKGQQLFSKLQKDLPRKKIGTIKLEEPITNLLSLMDAKEDIETLNILFIEGIDKSLPPYMEKDQYGYYNLEVLPPILNHLNRKRENFRERFPYLCLVFVVPPFALKYFMYRAIDFFDWRSGIWTFAPEEGQLAQATTQALSGEYSKYLGLSAEERNEKTVELQDLIASKNQTDEQRSQLCVEQCLVFAAAQEFEAALRCCEEAIAFDSKNEAAWRYKGNVLSALGRKEEAIAAYDQALVIKPDKHSALYNKGNALSALGRKEEAIAAYDQALAIKPDKHSALTNKGVALSSLGRNEEAIASYDQALAIKPDKHEALNNKGYALSALGRNEEAIAAYDQALAIKPDKHEALINKGLALSELGRNEEAIATYDQAIKIKPDHASAWYNKACLSALLNQSDDALIYLRKAMELEGGNKYNEMAKTDADFDSIRHDLRFQALISAAE
jgi:tetratricopeptide (TPR) repeat protein